MAITSAAPYEPGVALDHRNRRREEIGVASIFGRKSTSDFDGESESTNCPSKPSSSG